MYKNKYIINSLRFFAITCTLMLFTNACSNSDDLNTDILASTQTTIKAYGPNPALRGQSLSIAGTHLNKISKVILPHNIEITDIEVVSDKSIKVLLPQETVEGVIKLVDAKGTEYIFTTPLMISEPIEITKMTPQPIKSGQVLTLEGNYFNLIDKVILSDKVEILKADFITYSRTKIELTLPAEAQTGVVTLQNSDEIPLEYVSSEQLKVVLPSVDEVADLSDKKPGDIISIKGKDLDLTTKVQMPNGIETEYEVADNAITFTLPSDISDGIISMITASGVEVPIAHIGIALPQDIVANPVANLRSGDIITITGKNMELVTNISFNGVEETIVPESKSNTELKVKFPEIAQSGDMTLNTASGKSVKIEVVTQKPSVTSMSPVIVSGGQELTLLGSNLDLIVSIIFPDNIKVEVMPVNSEELKLKVPLNAVPGELTLNMNNKEIVKTELLEITSPDFCFIPQPPGPKAEIHAGGVLTLQVENGSRLNQVQINGSPVNYIHDAPNLYVVIPGNAKGATELKLISDNGEATYTIPVIGAGIIETVIYEGDLYALNWSEGLRLNKEHFESVPAGSKLKIYMGESSEGASIAYSDANWTKFIINDPNFDTQWGTISVPVGSKSYEIELTPEILNGILTVKDGWSNTGIMLTGGGVIVSKISIIVGSEPEETLIFEGNHTLSWGEPLRLNKEDIEEARNGSIIKLYFTAGASPSFAVQDANWAKVSFTNDPNFDPEWGSITVPAGETIYEVVLSKEILDIVMNVSDGWSTSAILLTGSDMTISKVTLIK